MAAVMSMQVVYTSRSGTCANESFLRATKNSFVTKGKVLLVSTEQSNG